MIRTESFGWPRGILFCRDDKYFGASSMIKNPARPNKIQTTGLNTILDNLPLAKAKSNTVRRNNHSGESLFDGKWNFVTELKFIAYLIMDTL